MGRRTRKFVNGFVSTLPDQQSTATKCGRGADRGAADIVKVIQDRRKMCYNGGADGKLTSQHGIVL